MLFLGMATIMGSVMLLIGILSLLLAIAAIRTHRSAEAKFFSCFIGLCFGSLAFYPFNKLLVFTTLEWTILVSLVLVALILVVILDWVWLKRDKWKLVLTDVILGTFDNYGYLYWWLAVKPWVLTRGYKACLCNFLSLRITKLLF